MDYTASFQDPALCQGLLSRLESELQAYGKPVRFMEVCGTHTVAIFQSGLRSLLPKGLEHVSGPGCPVCVTHDSEVAAFLDAADQDNVIVATFGDLMRVPGPDGRSLKHAQADGADVRVVYSPLDAVELAANNAGKLVVFLGVGFETTAPAVAGAVLTARARGLKNFCVLPCHKLVPPAVKALLDNKKIDSGINMFLLPGHVAIVLGLEPFRFVADYGKPAVVGGFEPADVLSSLCLMMEQLRNGTPQTINNYTRAVADDGSPAARAIMTQVFATQDARWRGLGIIPQSGLGFRKSFKEFDAFVRLGLTLEEARAVPGCRCGDVLSGIITPNKCPLFGKVCTPQNPTGPCMVSTEGSCAAWYKYGGAE